MSAFHRRAQRALFVLVAGLMGLSLFAPIVALGNVAPTSSDLLNQASYQDTTETTETTSEEDGIEDAEEAAPESGALPWMQPIDYGVVVDNSSNPLPGDGLACRIAPSGSAADVTRLFIGQAIEVTGASVWAEGFEFLPINCGGQGGYVKADYVQLNSEPAESVELEVVEEVIPTDEIVVEEVAPANEAAPKGIQLAGDLIITVTDQNGRAVAGVCFDLYNAAGWVANTCDSSDAIPGNGNSGFFGVAPGAYTVVPTAAPEGVEIRKYEAWVDSGTSAYLSVSAIGASAPAEEVTTEVVVTNEPVVTPEVPTQAPATQTVLTEDLVVTEAAPTEEPVTEEAETAEPAATEVVTAAVSTEVADSGASATVESSPVATDVPTEAAADTSLQESIVAPTEAPAGPDLSRAIGDATVTGTNGEGVRCRVAPDPSAATITVLAEGATVFVLEAPANGFIGVACGNQLGYADVNFMWSGGAGEDIPASAGSVVVVGTGGMALNCRSGPGSTYGVITSVRAGSVLTSRGASTNGWAPVVCNGLNGYVSINFVEVSGSAPTGTATPTATPPVTGGVGGQTGTGTVTNTGGASLNCRTAPGGTVITRLPEGTVLNVRGAASNGWVPVVCGGMNGFVSAEFFTIGAGSGTTSPTPTPGTGTGTTTGYVKVTGTGGGSLNCRSAPSLSGLVLSIVPYGATLQVRGASSNGWTPVNCGGKNGYVSSQYVTSTSGGGTTTPTTPTPTPGGSTGTATVSNTGGDRINCRISPGGAVITALSEGTVVTTRGASTDGWTPIVCAGRDGYMSSQFLTAGGSTGTNPTPTPTTPPSAGSGIVTGDHVKVGGSTNMRYEPSLNANVVMVIPGGEVLLARASASNGWVSVDYDGLRGYISASLLTETSEALSQRGGSGEDPDPAPGTGSPSGSAIVNFAMRYLGYPYVSATHGPSSFDCSGFTYWVVKNVLGRDIGTGTWTQTVAGTPVSRGSLQPGDLVFFQNTYKAGLSHVGIYIGGDQFIHAENQTTGVRISLLSSTYYSSRWYGAVRL